jgi:hypothetical protein
VPGRVPGHPGQAVVGTATRRPASRSRSCDSRHPGLWSRSRPGPRSPRPGPGRAFRPSHAAVPVVAWPTPGPGSPHPGPVPGCQPGVPACVHSPGGVPVGPGCPIQAVVASIPVGGAVNRGPVHLGGMRRSAGRVALRPHGHPTDPSPAYQPDGFAPAGSSPPTRTSSGAGYPWSGPSTVALVRHGAELTSQRRGPHPAERPRPPGGR